MSTNYVNTPLYEHEAERFNAIATNIDRFAEIIEALPNNELKEKSKFVLAHFEQLILQSPEWLFNDGLPGINMGFFGSGNSGWKEVLAIFVDNQDLESFEGIRVKHVLKLKNETRHLLLIRHDNDNIPDKDFCNWADCGMFIFKLINERSFKEALLSHKEFISLRASNNKRAAMVLVGCRDGISKSAPRIKCYAELKAIATQYGFDDYIEVGHGNGYNIFFLFEYCTLLSSKWKYRSSSTTSNKTSTADSVVPFNEIDPQTNVKKRKTNKRKTCIGDEFKAPTIVPQIKKISKDVKRTSSITESSQVENMENRRQSFNIFKQKGKSLPRPVPIENSSSFSSSSSLSEQNCAKEPILLSNKNVVMQGYLVKGRHKKFVTITNDSKMFYHSSKQDYANDISPKYIDLQFSNAKVPGNNTQNGHFSRVTKGTKRAVDEEDRKTFIINTRNDKNQCISRIYKALTEEERNNWVNVIADAIFQNYAQTKIDCQYKSPVLDDSVDNVMIQIQKQFGNDKCAECDAKNPIWVVYNFGILICDRCSGGHRNLGVEISKVCSLKLDGMDTTKIQILQAFGNTLVNSVMEAKLALTDDVKPTPESPNIDEWLRNKYVNRKYIPPLPLSQDDIQKQLIFAIQEKDRRYQLLCIMNAKKEQLNEAYDPEDSRNSLMIASRVGDIVMVQLLLWNGVDPTLKDASGLNALTFASFMIEDKSPSDLNRMHQIQELLKKFKTPVQQLCKLRPSECA